MTSQLGLDHGPYDCYLSHNQSGSVVNQGYQLNTDENGFLVWRDGLAPAFVPQTGNTEFALNAQPPEIDVAVEFEDWSLGAGFEDAPPGLVQRVYDYSQGVDASWGTRAYLSPELQTGGAFSDDVPTVIMQVATGPASLPATWAVGGNSIFKATSSSVTIGGVTAQVVFTDVFYYDNGIAQFLMVAAKNNLTQFTQNGSRFHAAGSTLNTVAHRNTQSAVQAAATTDTVTKPTSTAEDDILVAVVVTDNDANGGQVRGPTGETWAVLETDKDATASGSMDILWKRAGSSEGANYAFDWTTSAASVIICSAYTNGEAVGVAILNSTIGDGGTATTSHTSPALTFTNVASMIVRMTAGLDAASNSWSGVTNERADVAQGNLAVVLGDEVVADADQNDAALTHTSAQTCTSLAAAIAITPSLTSGHRIQYYTVRPNINSESVLWGITAHNQLVNTVDPGDPTAWSAADDIRIGDATKNRVAGMVTLNNEIVIVHAGGITAYDGVTVNLVFEPGTLQLDVLDARPYVHIDGKMYFTYSGTLFSYDQPTNRVTRLWPRGPQQGNAETNGIITSITGDSSRLYFSLKNAASNYYICSLDPDEPVTVGGSVIWPMHTIAYRGSAECRAVAVLEAGTSSFNTTNPVLAFGDGSSIDYFILPRPNLRPEDDGNVRYDTTADRILVGPFTAFGAQAYPKFLTRGDVEGDDLDADDTITLQYQEPGGSATTIVTANTDLRTTKAVSTEVEFTTLRPVTLLNNGASTTTPVWKGSVLHATPNPVRKRLFQFEVKIGDNLLLEGGPPSLENARFLRDHLFAAVNERVTLRDRWGSSFTVRVLEVQGLGLRKGELSDFEVISVTAAEI